MSASAARPGPKASGSMVPRDASASNPTQSQRPTIKKKRMPSSSSSVSKSPVLVYRMYDVVHQFYKWKNAHRYLGRYSVEKLLAFEEYLKNTSLVRVIGVILLTPVPSLLLMCALAAIPLQDPLLGASENIWCFAQSAISYTIMTFGLLLFVRQSLGWTNEVYSNKDAFIISVLTAATNKCFMAMLAFTWCFPVPFRDLLGSCSFFVWFSMYHVLLLGKSLRPSAQKLISYAPLFLYESSSLFTFEAIAIIFKNVSAETQAVIAVCFPIIKALLKRMIWYYAHRLDDISTDATVCSVEIFGSLFQNMCIQNVQSIKISVLIVLIDGIQAILETKMYLNHKFIVDGRLAVPTAVNIIESALFPGVAKANLDYQGALTKYSNKRTSGGQYAGATFNGKLRRGSPVVLAPKNSNTTLSFMRTRSRTKIGAVVSDTMLGLSAVDADPATGAVGDANEKALHEQKEVTSVSGHLAKHRINVDDIALDHNELAILLTQTLQLLFSSEVLVFSEYVEFIVPILYGLYFIVLYNLPYAKYSIAFIGVSHSEFLSSTLALCAYSGLECLSMLVMFYLVKVKYGLSALYQVAFVLENYWVGVQGRLLGSLVLIFNLNTVHHDTSPVSSLACWGHLA